MIIEIGIVIIANYKDMYDNIQSPGLSRRNHCRLLRRACSGTLFCKGDIPVLLSAYDFFFLIIASISEIL